MSPVESSSAEVSGPFMITWKYTFTVCGAEKNGETVVGVGRSYWLTTRSFRCLLPASTAASGPSRAGRMHADWADPCVVVALSLDAALDAAVAQTASESATTAPTTAFHDAPLITRTSVSRAPRTCHEPWRAAL